MVSTNWVLFVLQTSSGPRLVMTLRTPRRRISPRTKRKYRAIREFFRRALGSTSQQEIKINSSIAVNVTDLKRKIVGLEQQLDEVNRHCRDFVSLEDCSRKESDNILQNDFRHEIDTIKEQTEASSERRSNGLEAQLIYKSSDDSYKKFEDCNYISKSDFVNKLNENQIPTKDNDYTAKVDKNKTKSHHNPGSKLHKHKAKSVYDNIISAHSTSSFYSLTNTRMKNVDADYPNYFYDNKPITKEKFREIIPQYTKDRKYKDFLKKNTDDHFKVSYEDKTIRHRKNKQCGRNLDQDFIADIIRKQYKPVKMFGRKVSDFSQFSAPVCRDQEFSINENIQESSELCSCFYPGTGRRYKRLKHQDLGGMRSVCDTRLYSSNKHVRPKHRRMQADTYSNSDLYDFIPVKERSSPKTRRKFADANMIPYDYYREVPPSPRTLRPRLNLKAQYYTELEDYMTHGKQKFRRRLSQRQKMHPADCEANFEADTTSELVTEKKIPQTQKYKKGPIEEKQIQDQNQQQNTGTMSSLQYSQYINEQTSTAVDTSLNKTQETEINVDKTDKALCEIKDILQSFLHEIKKETVASQCDKSDITCKTHDNDSNILQDPKTKINSNAIPNSASFNNYMAGPCGIAPYIPPFPTNPCCYPLMPVCPINCPMQLQNGGYLMPSRSYTCANCVNCPKESVSTHCSNKNTEPTCNTETDELIKKIYNFVAQGPTGKQMQNNSNDRKHEVKKADADKILTSRSVGGSHKNYQHDAKVGTQPLKCYSKSCEAIGSRVASDAHYSGTNASYSDTLLERLSLGAGTHSESETELDTETTDPEKSKGNKFAKVLRSFGLFKKKKKDVIEEVSESESLTEINNKPKPPPFRQQVTNYVMHGQEYHHPPPIKPIYARQQDYQRRPNDHHSGPTDHRSGPNDYHSGLTNYRSGSHDYQPTSQDYEERAKEYQQQTHEYQSRPHEYHSRRHEYKSGPHEYQPRPNEHQQSPREYQPEFNSPYNPDMRGYPSPQFNDPYGQMRGQQHPRTRDHPGVRPPHSRQPTAPPYSSSYDTSYGQVQPPLCLKEIEVKSTGTQSERKVSIFRKFKKKMQQPVIVTHMAAAGDQRSFSTQTAASNAPRIINIPPPKKTKPLINWKSLQEKARRAIPSPDLDPIAFSYKTQAELAKGNVKMRDAVLKRMFYKRNPFSPRNMIVKTLLGRDKASYGDGQAVFRPRMFF